MPAFLEGGKAERRWVVSGRSSCTVQPAAFSRESVHFVFFLHFVLFVYFVHFVHFVQVRCTLEGGAVSVDL